MKPRWKIMTHEVIEARNKSPITSCTTRLALTISSQMDNGSLTG